MSKTTGETNNDNTKVPVTVQKRGINGYLAKVHSFGRMEYECPELANLVTSVALGYDAVLYYVDDDGVRHDCVFVGPHFGVSDCKVSVLATAMEHLRRAAAELPVTITHKGDTVDARAVKAEHEAIKAKRAETRPSRSIKVDRVTCDRIATCPRCGHRFAVSKHLV